MNRRVAAVRGLFDFAVMSGDVNANPIPSPRRSGGLRTARRGLLGHVAGRRPRSDGRVMRQVTVTGKGGKQRTVPVDQSFFTALGSYFRVERPAGLCTPECFVVLRG